MIRLILRNTVDDCQGTWAYTQWGTYEIDDATLEAMLQSSAGSTVWEVMGAEVVGRGEQ